MFAPGFSPSRKHRPKTGLGQDAGHFRSLVTLDLDPPLLHRAASATGLLHRSSESLFLGQADADKASDDRHRLSAAVRGLAYDVHPAAVLPRHG